MEPIRILHVVGLMNRGGAETLIMNLYRNIDRSKIQFDFLTHHSCKGAYDDEIKELGGRIYNVPYGIKTFHFGYIKSLNEFFKSHKEYKIVHSHMINTSGIICKVAKSNGVQVRIAHSHIAAPKHSLLQLVYFRWYAKNLIPKYCNNFFACSEKAADYLYPKYILKDNLKILKNSVDIDKFLPDAEKKKKVRHSLNIDNKLVLGHVGRFETQKNHSFLIDVFARLKTEIPNSILLLVGGGALGNEGLKPEIEEKVRQLKLEEDVKFLGVRSDINEIMNAMDIFVFPSLYEGLPVTLVEAQATGLPCLIADTITKEIDLENSRVEFLPLNNVNIWVDRIKEMKNIKKTTIESCKESIVSNGYDIKRTSKLIEEFYLNSIKK